MQDLPTIYANKYIAEFNIYNEMMYLSGIQEDSLDNEKVHTSGNTYSVDVFRLVSW